jgi:hypothetical protein
MMSSPMMCARFARDALPRLAVRATIRQQPQLRYDFNAPGLSCTRFADHFCS